MELKMKDMDEQIAKMLPKELKSTKELLFNSEAALFRNVEKNADENVVSESAGGASFMVKIQEPDEFVYSDVVAKKNIEQREFMTRNFLITTSTDTTKWKMTGNQKTILEIPCMEAELMGAASKTRAWFAPSIAVSVGPDGYTGLPGLILSLNINDGERTFEAKKVERIPVDSKELVKPKDGKKVTKAEFKKIVEEKKREREASGGSGVIIMRQN